MISYIHIGSNQGDKIHYLKQAIIFIEDTIGKIVSKSSFYQTEAWGKKDQDDFINLALGVENNLSINDMISKCQMIESKIGKKSQEKWGPREIDIDVLFHGNLVYNEAHITVPHPRLHERNFVLIPMMEIAPDVIHPQLNRSIEELYDVCQDMSEVLLLES